MRWPRPASRGHPYTQLTRRGRTMRLLQTLKSWWKSPPPRPRLSVGLRLEQLESREVPALSASLVGTELVVLSNDLVEAALGGTAATNDTIRVDYIYTPSFVGGYHLDVDVRVTAQTASKPVQVFRFARSSVQSIRIDGGFGNDTLTNDTDIPSKMEGGWGDDTLKGGYGDDQLTDSFGDVTYLYGGSGNDVLISYSGRSYLYGGPGDDGLQAGGSGISALYGGDGNDWLAGGLGDDTLVGGTGNDTLGGSDGRDTLVGNDGNDKLNGGYGDDFLYGEAGNDELEGWYGNDFLYGATGDDTLKGDEGLDRLYGEDGNDKLDGGRGADEVWGGSGYDVAWVFYSQGPDTIAADVEERHISPHA